MISTVKMNIYEGGADYITGDHLNNHEYVSVHLDLMGQFSVLNEASACV